MATSQGTRVWFITGASTGFGRLLAETVLARGERVVCTARDERKVEDLTERYPQQAIALALDVTQKDQIGAAVQDAIDAFGRIDVLVNNAGYGLVGAAEEATDEEIERVIATNVFGLVDTTRAVLPHLRAQKAGHILNLSSIAGLVGGQGLSYYNLTKFAVEGFSEGLAAEMKPFGVHVTLIEPGPFRTDFLGRSAAIAEQRIPDYDATAGTARRYFETENGKQKGDPQRAVEAMIAVVDADRPPLRLLLGSVALGRVEKKLENWRAELEEWRGVTLGADYPEGG